MFELNQLFQTHSKHLMILALKSAETWHLRILPPFFALTMAMMAPWPHQCSSCVVFFCVFLGYGTQLRNVSHCEHLKKKNMFNYSQYINIPFLDFANGQLA